ncbi:MAG: hypothetical protein OIF50_10400 [Flavobacteriaceae bacterium]|nr:hypothetical protein [Flavobacteriaceae bacterium]
MNNLSIYSGAENRQLQLLRENYRLAVQRINFDSNLDASEKKEALLKLKNSLKREEKNLRSSNF